MSQNVVGCALVILPMLGLACLSVAENLGESGLNEWFTANQFHMECRKAIGLRATLLSEDLSYV